MSVAESLVRLYPAPFRDQWGAGLADEAVLAGRRAWPNLVLGVVDAWLHPSVWPASSRAQRRFRAGAMAVTLALLSWFVVHLTAEVDSPSYSGGVRALALDGVALLLCLGLALVSPWPRLSRHAVRVLARRVVRLLLPPAVLAAAVVVLVNGVIGGNGLDSSQPLPVRVVVLGCWWLALAGGAVQACRILPGLADDVVVPPSPGRLRLGLGALAGSAVCSAIVLLSLLPARHGIDPMAVAGAVVLLGLTLLALITLRDQRRLP